MAPWRAPLHTGGSAEGGYELTRRQLTTVVAAGFGGLFDTGGSTERCPALHPWNDARWRAWNGSWNGAAGIPTPPELSLQFPVPSVQLLRTVRDAVVMVRRRSTVRFRNGAPGHHDLSVLISTLDFKIK
jgi:hypothetical protein